MVALQSFSTGLQADEALLQPQQQQQQQTQQEPATADSTEPLSQEMTLALRFRAERKRMLLHVVEGLAARLKQVRAAQKSRQKRNPACLPA